MATRADAHVSTNEAIHTGYEIKDLSLRLPKTDETVKYTRYGACQNSVHGNFLRDNIKLNADLVLGKWHVDKDIANEYKHNP